MTSRPSTEQLLVQVLMRASQEVLRAYAETPEDSEDRAKAEVELTLAFAPIWRRMPFLEVEVRDRTLWWEDRVVLVEEEDGMGLIETLVISGVHGLTLVPGVGRDEMARFLQLVDRKRRLDEDGDQDLVLMLFRADLHHIRYTVGAAPGGKRPVPAGDSTPSPEASAQALDLELDIVVDDDSGAVPTTAVATRPMTGGDEDAEPIDAHELKAAVRADAERPDDRRPIVQLEKFDSTLYFLDQKEIEYLRTSIDREYSQDHTRNVLALLLDILEIQSHPEVREEVIDILGKLLPYLLASGHFPSVAYLTSEVRALTRRVELDEKHKEALDNLRVSISDHDALTQLFHVLDDGNVEPTPEELATLLREMRQDAIQTVLVWIGQLQRPAVKSAVVEATEDFFREWPAALGKMTEAADRTVVQRALGIARKLQHPDFVEPVETALASKHAGTRRLAIETLAAIGAPPAVRAIARSVDDPDAEVRTSVYEALSTRPYRGAEKGLRAAVTSSDVEARGLSERRALFAAYGTISGAGGVPTLEPILQGKGGFGRRPSPGTRACAALALGIINSPAARFALEEAAKDKEPLVRSAAGSALRAEPATS